MSNIYSPEAQQSINAAENKLGDAIKTLQSQPKNDDPIVEVVQENTPDIDVEIDTPAPVKEPRRSEFVKTDDPKVLERINDLYGQVKKSDNRNQMIIDHNRQLEERLAEAVEKLNKLERNTQDSATNKVESELKAALRTAREEGDFDNVQAIEDKLLDLKLERRLSDKIPTQKEVVKAPDPQKQQFETQLIHNAHYIENLALEKDAQGNLLRPYLYDWHPKNKEAVEMFTSIPQEFAAAGKRVDMETMMKVLDERIRGKKSTSQQPSVLGAETNDAPTRTTVRLTQAEINVAKNMGISPERYARQKQLMNS